MKKKRKIGLAKLSKKRRREIASMGGKAAWAAGKGRGFTSETAKAAGKIGGKRLKWKRPT